MGWSVGLAFIIDVIGTFLVQLSYMLMKLSHHSVEDSHEKKRKSGFCTLKWWIGFSLICIGNLLHMVALPHLDLIIWTINSGTGLIFDIILSILILKEKFILKYDLTCFILVTAGCGTILLLSNQEE